MHLMRAKPFIEDSVATLREHQSLLEVLTKPGELQQEQPSAGTTERAWREYGVVVGPRLAPLKHASANAGLVPVVQLAGPGQLQHQPHHPAPLGMALLLQQQMAALEGVQQQGPMAPPRAAPPPVVGSQLAVDADGLPLCTSVEMLPVLPSIGGLPTLSQLIDEPSAMMTSLSLTATLHQAPPGTGTAPSGVTGTFPAPIEAGAPRGMQHTAAHQDQGQHPAAGAARAQEQHPLPPASSNYQPSLFSALQPSSAFATGQPASAQLAAAQRATAGAPPSQTVLSPASSGDQTSSCSGNLSYRRVSFAPLHPPAPRSNSLEEGPNMPFLVQPPPPAAAAAAGAPVSTALAAALAQPAGGRAAPTLPAPVPVPAMQPTHVAVVQAGTAVRIAQSAGPPAPKPDTAADPQQCTTATARGPVAFVSVHQLPAQEALGDCWPFFHRLRRAQPRLTP